MKPCKHERSQFGCRICWLNDHDPRYKALWGRGGNATVSRVVQPIPHTSKCLHFLDARPSTGHRDNKDWRRCAETGKEVCPCNNCAVGCPHYAVAQEVEDVGIKWAYGVTTVPVRRQDLLPRTLASLDGAGFPKPRIFADGTKSPDEHGYDKLGLEVTCRFPRIKTWGNWVLGLYELFIRDPQADRYAMFQDDFVTYPNLRAYLDSCRIEPKTYWNLYLFPCNEALIPREGPDNLQREGWHRSNQRGLGAVGLVFDRDTVLTLMASYEHVVERPLYADRGTSKVDGAVVDALKKQGWSEVVHYPSLVQHTGDLSVMNNPTHRKALSFRGEEFDAKELVKQHAPVIS